MAEALYKKPKKWEEKHKEGIGYWKDEPWEKKWADPEYVKFEAARAKEHRAELAEKAAKENAAAHKKAIAAAEDELKKPWGQRKRNAGLANKFWWRPFGLALDIAALPFAAGSWILSRLARPIRRVNERLLGNKGYGEKIAGDKKTNITKGTTFKKDFFPSIGTERRKLGALKKKR